MQHQALSDYMLVERHLARRGLRRRFAPELKQRFEAGTAPGRGRNQAWPPLPAARPEAFSEAQPSRQRDAG